MKKFYQIILKVTLISLFGIIPVIFYGQETEEKVEIKVKEKTGSFDPYWFFGGHIGASIFHGDVARYNFAPDWNKIDIGGDLYFGRQTYGQEYVLTWQGQKTIIYLRYDPETDRGSFSYFSAKILDEISRHREVVN